MELQTNMKNKTYVSFETWEKLPSNFKLTKGECNQLYNIISWLTPGDEQRISLKSASSFLKGIAAKLEKEI
tara:strand:- start:22 stop:234 length:213 start_codon:yes stop_codon:yes gene_type:complete